MIEERHEDLKRYALDMAIRSMPNHSPDRVVVTARMFYAFLCDGLVPKTTSPEQPQ